MPSSYVLGTHFEHFVRQQIDAGRYQSASEVVRDAMRLLEERTRWQQAKLEVLRADIRKGVDSGPGQPVEQVAADLKARYRQWTEHSLSANAL